MRKLLTKLSPYSAIVMMGIWSGAIMTRAQRHTIHPSFPATCMCGADRQDLPHLLWGCPEYAAGHDPLLTLWNTLPGAASSCLLCPRKESLNFRRDWQRICRWALKVMTRATNDDRNLAPGLGVELDHDYEHEGDDDHEATLERESLPVKKPMDILSHLLVCSFPMSTVQDALWPDAYGTASS